MKQTLLLLLTLYQKVLSPLMYQLLGARRMCRYPLTCSAYAKAAIEKHGAVQGSVLSLKRLAHCQPFSNSQNYANL